MSWFRSRFMPHYPVAYGCFGDMPVQVFEAWKYLDTAYMMTGTKAGI